MSDENDSWLQNALGVDVQGILGNVPEMPAAIIEAPPPEAPAPPATGEVTGQQFTSAPEGAAGTTDNTQASLSGVVGAVGDFVSDPIGTIEGDVDCYREKTVGVYKSWKKGSIKPGEETWIFIHKGSCACEGKTADACQEPGDENAASAGPAAAVTNSAGSDSGGSATADLTAGGVLGAVGDFLSDPI